MGDDILAKLSNSLDELERSISAARRALTLKDPVPLDVIRRISSYEDIIQKQRLLSGRLSNLMVAGKWDDVSRHVKLINGFSAMIHEDASSLLKSIDIENFGTTESLQPN